MRRKGGMGKPKIRKEAERREQDERKIRKDGTKTGGRDEQESTTRRGKNAEKRK